MKHRLMITTIAIAIALATCGQAAAQSGGGYDLTWNNVSNGGGTSSGSGYELNGTIGQADAGAASNGGCLLSGGFWYASPFLAFVPLVRKA
jgi:hypothetical protein